MMAVLILNSMKPWMSVWKQNEFLKRGQRNFEPIIQVLGFVNKHFHVMSTKDLALAPWLGSTGLNPIIL
jgi:hypothetical protein